MATKGTFRLTLMDVEGDFLEESAAEVAFFRVLDNRQLDDVKRIDFSRGAVDFSLQAFPAGPYYCQISPMRYRLLKSGIFSLTAGQVTAEQQFVPRDPGRWRSQFAPWAALDGGFGQLQQTLTASGDVNLFEGGSNLGVLVGEAYDKIVAGPPGIAKTSMLNLYYKLTAIKKPVTGQRSWMSFVLRVVAIGRERLIAVADADLAKAVGTVLAKIDDYPEWHAAEDAEGHRGNIPAQYRPRVTEMLSIKESVFEASLQVTAGVVPNSGFVILDADIDEHGELVHHGFDWVSHWFTGGTHPYDVHEFLARQAREAQRTINLGYTLVTA